MLPSLVGFTSFLLAKLSSWGFRTVAAAGAHRVGRPVLRVEFENREPLVRRSDINVVLPAEDRERLARSGEPYRPTGLFFRVRVHDDGHEVARKVIGRLTAIFTSEGEPVTSIDPFPLHWVGRDSEAIDVRPDAPELIDVFSLQWDGARLFGDHGAGIVLYPCDASDRGIQFEHPVAGQIIRVQFSADNTPIWCGIELRLPASTDFGARSMVVEHRLIWAGNEHTKWEQLPPGRVLEGGHVIVVTPVAPGARTTTTSTNTSGRFTLPSSPSAPQQIRGREDQAD